MGENAISPYTCAMSVKSKKSCMMRAMSWMNISDLEGKEQVGPVLSIPATYIELELNNV